MTDDFKKRIDVAVDKIINDEIKKIQEAEKICEQFYQLIEAMLMHFSLLDNEFVNYYNDETIKKIAGDYKIIRAGIAEDCATVAEIKIEYDELPEFHKGNFLQSKSFLNPYVRDTLIKNEIFVGTDKNDENCIIINFDLKYVYEKYNDFKKNNQKALNLKSTN